MSKTNAEDVEAALAEEKANQYWIGATVQVARAGADRRGTGTALAWQNEAAEWQNKCLQAWEERDALQAQRDELLAALTGLIQANHEGMLTTAEWDAAAVAFARATEGGKANES